VSDAARSGAQADGAQPATAPGRGGPDRDWDADTYHRISGPQQSWAGVLIERLALGGDETVLDAGCGSGAVTAMLVQRLPRGRVYAVDAAPSMVEHTRQALGDRVIAYCQDLVELSLPEPVDAVFSNAVFHWIPDHQRLFGALAGAMKPGARLVAQCGGAGNIDHLRRTADMVAAEPRFAEYFADWAGPWNYPSPEETAGRLQAAGFSAVETWLEPRPTTLEQPHEFLRTVCLLRHLDRLPPELHEGFVATVLERTGVPLTLDYVRLNMVALAGPKGAHQGAENH
jgi:trans-aconitate 2-methyltransferase